MRQVANVLSTARKAFSNRLLLLVFLNGFFLALLVYFYTEDNYEAQLFRALATQVREQSTSNNIDTLILNSLHLTHELEKHRLSVFGNKNIRAFKSDLIRPVTYDLMTGSGACGSFSYVLGRILAELKIEIRFAQMNVNGVYGAHNVIEARSGDQWVVLDPIYDLYFVKSDGRLASFKEVSDNWSKYKETVPVDYNQDYSYSSVQYTNWNKIPVVMPAIKQVLNWTSGETYANEISLRSLFLSKFNILFKVTLFLYILFTFLLIRLYLNQSEEIEQFRLSMLFPKASLRTESKTVVAAS